ncbi:hypothetical protein [Amycolatopsis sp. NBC_00438]|uniref:hypothetical protein n=1 Tax=Amycolatopsis sp. NBC_00438 TaxID=2903558 RepID=UPI002E1C1EC5
MGRAVTCDPALASACRSPTPGIPTSTVCRDPSKTPSHKYLGEDPPPEGSDVERVIVRLRVEKIAGTVK